MGILFATRLAYSIVRIMQMLPGARAATPSKADVGSMARYTLASYAVRDAGLREFLRSELAGQPAESGRRFGE